MWDFFFGLIIISIFAALSESEVLIGVVGLGWLCLVGLLIIAVLTAIYDFIIDIYNFTVATVTTGVDTTVSVIFNPVVLFVLALLFFVYIGQTSLKKMEQEKRQLELAERDIENRRIQFELRIQELERVMLMLQKKNLPLNLSGQISALEGAVFNMRSNQHAKVKEARDLLKRLREEAAEKKKADAKKKKKAAEAKKKAAEAKKKAALKALKEKLRRLKTAGLPNHITTDYLSLNLSDKEYAELYKFLRSKGAPNESQSEEDVLNDIDYHVFTGTVSKEDGLFLITHRSHIELMKPFRNKKLSKKKADEHAKHVRWLLIEMGFEDYPEAVKKVAAGADPEAVASLDGIRGNSPSRTKKSRGESKAKSPKVDEPNKEKESPRGRRKGRFADD